MADFFQHSRRNLAGISTDPRCCRWRFSDWCGLRVLLHNQESKSDSDHFPAGGDDPAPGVASIDGVARVAPYFSLASAASYLEGRIGETGDVYYEGSLHVGSSLVFYLNRKFYLVNQTPDAFSQKFGPEAIYATEASVIDRWSSTDPVFLIVEQSRVPHWQALITERVHIYHQVTACGTYVVLSNQL